MSWTSQLWRTASGSQFWCGAAGATGRNALRRQPVHVRTIGVVRMKVVMEHRA